MFTCEAFLSPSPLANRHPRPTTSKSKPLLCSSRQQQDVSRRVFFSRVLNCATTVLLTVSKPFQQATAADSDPTQTPAAPPPTPPPPPPPRTKPKRATWGYTKENGPEQWGALSDEWALCSTGRSQSPIALSYRQAIPSGDNPRPKLTTTSVKHVVRLKEVSSSAMNRSLIVEPYIPPPPPIVGDAPPVDIYKPPPPSAVINMPNVATYALRSIHFHADSSEHMVEGRKGKVEAHFIFAKRARAPPPPTPPAPPPPAPSSSPESSPTAKSSDSVLTLSAATTKELLEQSQPEQHGVVSPAQAEGSNAPQTLIVAMTGMIGETCNPWLQGIVSCATSLTAEDARSSTTIKEFDLSEVLPDLRFADFYQYSGSLTTPPGTEGVCWLVLGKRMTVTNKEVDALLEMQGGPNVRPLQPLNGRKILRFPSLKIEEE